MEHVFTLTADPDWVFLVGFAGVSFRNDDLTIEPRLPASRRSLRISMDLGKQTVEAIMQAGEPMASFVGGQPNQISSAATLVIPIRSPQER